MRTLNATIRMNAAVNTVTVDGTPFDRSQMTESQRDKLRFGLVSAFAHRSNQKIGYDE